MNGNYSAPYPKIDVTAQIASDFSDSKAKKLKFTTVNEHFSTPLAVKSGVS
ncbi:MAG: hypothetical protein R8J84_07365 [Mariprofundales bacterium]